MKLNVSGQGAGSRAGHYLRAGQAVQRVNATLRSQDCIQIQMKRHVYIVYLIKISVCDRFAGLRGQPRLGWQQDVNNAVENESSFILLCRAV